MAPTLSSMAIAGGVTTAKRPHFRRNRRRASRFGGLSIKSGESGPGLIASRPPHSNSVNVLLTNNIIAQKRKLHKGGKRANAHGRNQARDRGHLRLLSCWQLMAATTSTCHF